MTEALLARRGAARRRVPLAARARLERADPRRRRGGRLRARRSRACGPQAEGSARRSSRSSPPPRSLAFADAGVDVGGRRGRARRPARRDERPRARASSCSRTSRSTTRRCSATRARRSRPRSSRSSSPAATVVARRAGVGAARARRRRGRGRRRRAATSRSRPRRRGVPRQRRSTRPRCRSRSRAGSSGAALEIWDGAHNLAGVGYLSRGCRPGLHRRVDPRRQGRRRRCSRRSPSLGHSARRHHPRIPRSLPAGDLAERARPYFAVSRPSTTPRGLGARTRSASRCSSPARSTCSDLAWQRERERRASGWASSRSRRSCSPAIVGLAFAAGYLVGKLLL